MSLPQQVKSVFNSLVESGSVRYVTQPADAAPTGAVSDGAAAAWAWSAYVQICAAGVITDPSWLVGVHMCRPVIEAFTGDFAIASGAAASEVDLAIIPFDEELFAVVEGKSYIVMLPFPVKIVGSPRLAVRVRKDTGASAAGVSMKLMLGEAIG